MCWAVDTPPTRRGERWSRGGFTLVELLVVLGVIAVLLSLLLPALNAARRSSYAVRCAANVRTICAALVLYASDNNGRFPPNTDTGVRPQYWYDMERAGKYISKNAGAPVGKNSAIVYAPAVLGCPADPESDRSYSMNLWASGKIDTIKLTTKPKRGEQWNGKGKSASSLILVTERWASVRLSTTAPWTAPAYLGYAGLTPGQRFGAGGGLTSLIPTGRWGNANCELPYMRHRAGRAKSEKEPKGAVNVGYADGHVELKTEWMLADFATGKSTLDSLWSPYDTDPAFNK
jgi:prepilin-type N-terminal cleavage/methylation domain-containing protein/prepilin-type processing-associated H-X9-DG protein